MPIDFSTLGDNLIPENKEIERKRKIVEEQNKIYDEWLANKGEKGFVPFMKDVGASAIPGLAGAVDTAALIADLLNPYTAATQPLHKASKQATENYRTVAQDLAKGGQPEGLGKVAAQTLGGFAGSLPEMALIAPSGPIGFAAHGALKALESGGEPISAGLRGGTTGLAFELAKHAPGPVGKILGSAAAFAGPSEAQRVIDKRPIEKPEETLANIILGAALAAKGSMREKPKPRDQILDIIRTAPEQQAQQAVSESPKTKLVAPEQPFSPELAETIKQDYGIEKFNNLKKDITEKGIQEPILVLNDGTKRVVYDGTRRYLAAKELGMNDGDIPQKEIRVESVDKKVPLGAQINIGKTLPTEMIPPEQSATSVLKPGIIKQPWEMTKKEFDNEALYQGVTDITDKKTNYFTNSQGFAEGFANAPRGGNNPRLNIAFKQDIKPEQYPFKEGTENYETPQEYWKNRSEMEIPELSPRTTIPITESKNPHKYLVEKALANGEKIPQDVLSEYPELKPEPTISTPPEQPVVAPEPPTVNKSKEGIILYENKTPTAPIEDVRVPVEQKLIDAIKSAKPVRGKQEQLYTEERGKRMKEAEKIGKQVTGEKGYYAELSAMKGELPKVVFESIREKFTQEDVDGLFKKIKDNSVLTNWEKLPARKGLSKLLGEYGGGVPTENELALLDTVFGKEFTQTVQEARPLLKRMKDMGLQIANVPRSLMASFDLSAPFRQGMFFVSRSKQFFPAFKEMFSALGSEKGFKTIAEEISKQPTFDLMKESGLALTEMDKLMTGREERFQSQLAEKIPVVGKMVRASGRAYSGFLNKLRADVFNDLVTKAESQGLEPRKNMDLVKEIAKFVNAGTGRGSLGMGLERSATALNAFFFSPRLMASRLTLLNPMYYVKATPFVRGEALKSLFGFATTAGSIMMLAKLAGAKVEDDPRNSDFAKMKIGNTRIDMLGGFQQYIRAAAQIISGKYVSSVTGKEVNLGEGYKPLTRYDIAMRQIESKEAPVASFITTLLRGQDRMGQPVNYSKEITDRFIPMIIDDTIEIAKDNPDLIPAGLAGIFGFGIQTYQPKQGKNSKKKFDFSGL